MLPNLSDKIFHIFGIFVLIIFLWTFFEDNIKEWIKNLRRKK
jgi:hypothetical protein